MWHRVWILEQSMSREALQSAQRKTQLGEQMCHNIPPFVLIVQSLALSTSIKISSLNAVLFTMRARMREIQAQVTVLILLYMYM